MGRPSRSGTQSLAGAAVVVPARAPVTVRNAGAELSRCLYLLTGKVSPVVGELPERGTAVILGRKPAAALGVRADRAGSGDQGYRLAVVKRGRRSFVVVAARTPAGVLYGAYGLLERLGMGFYAGGETFPDLPAKAAVPADLDVSVRPLFAVRGNMLHYNFLCGCTNWGLGDYKFYFDQLARMRCNMLLMHWYDDEPGAAYAVRGEYLAGGITPNSLTKPWGAPASLRTSQFSFGTGRCFDEEIYSSPMGEDLPDLLTEVKRSEAMFRDATAYARDLGIEVAAGFEAPRSDPTDPAERARFAERLRQFAGRNPHITRLALWQHEGGSCMGSALPAAGSKGAALLERRRGLFAHLGNEQRVWEAIRYGRYAEIAAAQLAREFPHLRLVVVGWGGDRWMRFANLCLGYDKLLPPDVAFTCHENIDASMGPEVSTPWGELPPGRERWAMPWVEGDTDDCLVRQPNVESLGRLAPDALRKGCQGLLTLQWRTRDVEEETGYMARYAWDGSLTPDRFYRDMARRAFGPAQEKRMAAHLAVLQRLGSRWTGVRGTAECMKMVWTGWEPHYPFEVNGQAALYLARKAAAAAEALAEVPAATEIEGAFHLVDAAGTRSAGSDETRPGVAGFRQAARRLKTLASRKDPDVIRAGLTEVEEAVFALRPGLMKFGWTTRAIIAVDGFLFALHHVRRNAGAREHMAMLRQIRADLERLDRHYVARGMTARRERLDYLAATIDFALALDSTAMLLADGEAIERGIARAAAAAKAGHRRQAANTASEAYAALVDAGMADACAAFTRKLTTRCDFGTLTTLNVKHLGAYWQTVGELEGLMPAAPPRELRARGLAGEVWLSWQPDRRAAAQNLYRRRGGSKVWKRVNRDPLGRGCRMFVDRPARPGDYVYAATDVDGDGWESARSHPAHARYGPCETGPRLVAVKPPARLAAGEDLALRVVALSDRGVEAVGMMWRPAGARRWRRTPLVRRFRDSWHGAVEGAGLQRGIVEYYVTATDGEGNDSSWPASAPELPWTAMII